MRTFLYDGDCGFCSTCARVADRWVAAEASVEPWQRADLEALGVTAAESDESVQWIGSDGKRSSGPEAIADLMRTGRVWARPLGWVLARRLVLRATWPAYRWVSAHRDRMPGGTATCAMPAAERPDAS